MAAATATAEETLATQGADAAMASLQGSLRTSYDDLVRAAGQFGITGDEADTMARKALGIPKDVNIDAYLADYASGKIDAIAGKRDALDGTSATVNIYENTHRTNYEKRVKLADGGEPDGGGLYGSDRGGYTGGRVSDLMGFAGGGIVPGRPPANPTVDNVLALVNGKPLKVRSGEWIINEGSSRNYDRELAAINAGTFPKMPGYANGGRAGREYSAQSFGFAPAAVSSGPASFLGDLYLDSGEFLGKVRGVATQAAAGVLSEADSNSTRMRRGR
jgi:hypothetical protein